jgi:hypothetical protein
MPMVDLSSIPGMGTGASLSPLEKKHGDDPLGEKKFREKIKCVLEDGPCQYLDYY